MKRAPTAGEMEIALHQLLHKNQFTGREHVHVVAVGLESSPIYLVTLGADAAQALAHVLAPVLGIRSHPSPTNWVLFTSDAAAIVRSAK
jgi:hypothetical protein